MTKSLFVCGLASIMMLGCATTPPRPIYQHSEEAVNNLFLVKSSNYNEESDGKIYGVDLGSTGPQGFVIRQVDPDSGATGYLKSQATPEGLISTVFYLDEKGRPIKLARYWFGFPREDLLAIADGQRKFFLNNYALKLSLASSSLGEFKLTSKEQYLDKLRARSLECNGRCAGLFPISGGISKYITYASEYGKYIGGKDERFFSINIETKYMQEYKENKAKKYQQMTNNN